MSPPAILVPFKAGPAKSRLSPAMPPSQRKAFAYMTLLEVLVAVKGAGLLRRCYVVSSDDLALSLASSSGAKGIREPSDRGVNQAVAWGMSRAKASEFMIIPSDLPTLAPEEVRRAISLKAVADVVLAPSRVFDGTNLLVISAARPVDLSYDEDSFWNHLRSAARKGLRLAVCTFPGFVFDVDSPEDFAELARLPINRPAASFAREVLRERVS
jgi:2-phospho-L-lactate/phosphoenolpyruvate guanylyltransferase